MEAEEVVVLVVVVDIYRVVVVVVEASVVVVVVVLPEHTLAPELVTRQDRLLVNKILKIKLRLVREID